ncbi:MAG: hypothetical protein ACYCXY_11685 [Acidimicrobiales bacterium]
MATSQERIQSILQGVNKLCYARGEIDPESWIAGCLEELDASVWSIVEALEEEGRIAK